MALLDKQATLEKAFVYVIFVSLSQKAFLTIRLESVLAPTRCFVDSKGKYLLKKRERKNIGTKNPGEFQRRKGDKKMRRGGHDAIGVTVQIEGAKVDDDVSRYTQKMPLQS